MLPDMLMRPSGRTSGAENPGVPRLLLPPGSGMTPGIWLTPAASSASKKRFSVPPLDDAAGATTPVGSTITVTPPTKLLRPICTANRPSSRDILKSTSVEALKTLSCLVPRPKARELRVTLCARASSPCFFRAASSSSLPMMRSLLIASSWTFRSRRSPMRRAMSACPSIM